MIWGQKSSEAACLDAFMPPIEIKRPVTLSSPVIFASPHSGNVYPEALLSRTPLPLETLRRNEDAYIDALFAPAPSVGAPLLLAKFPRCFVDVNRGVDEVPQAWSKNPDTSTPRANMGLGVIPTIISDQVPIYSRTLKPSCVTLRLERLYHPYHAALKALIEAAKAQFGRALVIDCHSMPGFAPGGSRRTDIILGDRYGTSCTQDTLCRVERFFTERDYSVTRNYPYAGGYVTSHYGQPQDNVEVVQIEINRDLYLNPVTLKPKRGYDKLEENLSEIIKDIICETPFETLMAAE